MFAVFVLQTSMKNSPLVYFGRIILKKELSTLRVHELQCGVAIWQCTLAANFLSASRFESSGDQ